MAEYIDRNALMADLNRFAPGGYSEKAALIIGNQPAADVAPVRHGKWVHDRYENCAEGLEIVKCSNCSTTAYAIALYVKTGNYCPNCGAKMDGGQDDG